MYTPILLLLLLAQKLEIIDNELENYLKIISLILLLIYVCKNFN